MVPKPQAETLRERTPASQVPNFQKATMGGPDGRGQWGAYGAIEKATAHKVAIFGRCAGCSTVLRRHESEIRELA